MVTSSVLSILNMLQLIFTELSVGSIRFTGRLLFFVNIMTSFQIVTDGETSYITVFTAPYVNFPSVLHNVRITAQP